MDSSSPVTPPYVGAPLQLHPFRAMMLSPSRVSDPASARAFARPYQAVADRLRGWERAGHVRRDATAALYLHEYTSNGLVVRGLVGALDLSRRASSVADRAVLPHEGVHEKQAGELAARMAEMRMNPAPILLAHRGPALVRELLGELAATPPWAQFDDRKGTPNRVWRLEDPERIERINAGLAPASALIADGHHRYAAYLQLQTEQPGTPWDRGLVMLVDQDDTPLFLGPIHRELRGPRLGQLLEAAAPLAAVREGTRQDCVARLAPGAIVVTDGRRWASVHPHLGADHTPVEWFASVLLPELARPPQAVRYHHTVDSALAAVAGGTGPAPAYARGSRRRRAPGRVAALMPAPEFDNVHDAARAGHLLPEKATSFQPKPGLGVLMRSLHDE